MRHFVSRNQPQVFSPMKHIEGIRYLSSDLLRRTTSQWTRPPTSSLGLKNGRRCCLTALTKSITINHRCWAFDIKLLLIGSSRNVQHSKIVSKRRLVVAFSRVRAEMYSLSHVRFSTNWALFGQSQTSSWVWALQKSKDLGCHGWEITFPVKQHRSQPSNNW